MCVSPDLPVHRSPACTDIRSLRWHLYPCRADGSCFLRHGTEEAVLPPTGLLLGKEHNDHASTPLLPTPSAATLSPPTPGTSASSAHAKTGSKDSSTQTDKSAELFWPGVASLPTRSRLSGTPSNSPVLKHPAAKGTAEKLGTRSPPALTLHRAPCPVRGGRGASIELGREPGYQPTLTYGLSYGMVGEGNGNPLQYSCLENPMDGEAWYAIVHRVAKSWT